MLLQLREHWDTTWTHSVGLGAAVWGRGWNSGVLEGPFHLRIFCGSVNLPSLLACINRATLSCCPPAPPLSGLTTCPRVGLCSTGWMQHVGVTSSLHASPSLHASHSGTAHLLAQCSPALSASTAAHSCVDSASLEPGRDKHGSPAAAA